MNTKAKIQKVQSEIEAHEERGWLKGYEEGLAKREQEVSDLRGALEARNEKIQELTSRTQSPKTAREALELAWELAHEVKTGQTVPKGTRYLEVRGSGLMEYTTVSDFKIRPGYGTIRTLDPLPEPEPEPEPDWLDATAVLATMNDFYWQSVWLPTPDGKWKCTCCGVVRNWTELTDVTPLYPKEDA